MTVKVEDLKNQLMDRIDKTDLKEVEKVERYIKLIELDAALDAAIENDGPSVVTENGAQRFVKSHPAVGDKLKVNSQLLAIEKSFVFLAGEATPDTMTGGMPKLSDLR